MKKRLYICCSMTLLWGALLQADAPEMQPKSSKVNSSIYIAKDYSSLLGMPGFSEDLLKMHFTLYQGYVKNANLLLAKLQEMAAKGDFTSYEYGALKRRVGWEMDGMRLHEYYFDNLGGKAPLLESSSLNKQIQRDFGSFENWKKDFLATGAMRGIGWSILYLDPTNGRLINMWINEHDLGHLAGGTPILVMDVFEHAYMPQYGLDRAKYMDAFFQNINWEIAQKRYEAAQ